MSKQRSNSRRKDPGETGKVDAPTSASESRKDGRAGLDDGTMRLCILGELTAKAAHEINGPLASIMANLQYSMRELKRFADPDVQEILEALTDSYEGVVTIATLLSDMLVFSKPSRALATEVDVNETVLSTLRLFRLRLAAQNAVLTTELGSRMTVLARRGQLMQVIMNLLTNALDAQSDAEAQPDPRRVTISTSRQGEMVVVGVADNGPGVPREHRDHIFEPFFTTKGEKGTGLGLAICREIIEAHGGTLRYRPGSDGGAVFEIVLPRSTQASDQSASCEGHERTPTRGQSR